MELPVIVLFSMFEVLLLLIRPLPVLLVIPLPEMFIVPVFDAMLIPSAALLVIVLPITFTSPLLLSR